MSLQNFHKECLSSKFIFLEKDPIKQFCRKHILIVSCFSNEIKNNDIECYYADSEYLVSCEGQAHFQGRNAMTHSNFVKSLSEQLMKLLFSASPHRRYLTEEVSPLCSEKVFLNIKSQNTEYCENNSHSAKTP